MDFRIENECFTKAISDVCRAVSQRTPFPILSGIKILADEEGITLVGSNSDLIIQRTIPMIMDGVRVLEVYEPGSAVLSAKYVSEIVKKLPGTIHIKVNDKSSAVIQSEGITASLPGFQAEQYPSLPVMDDAASVTISHSDLLDIIKQTAFAAAKSESRPVLTGVNMNFRENSLTCAATNSHRLAVRKLALNSAVHGSFIVPAASLSELAKLLHHASANIHILVTDCYMVFKSNHTVLYTRLIEGTYPNVQGLVPSQWKTAITLGTQQLLKGIDRTCLFSSEWKNHTVHVSVLDGSKLKLSSASTEIGKIEEIQDIEKLEGEHELSISLDGSFLMDALKGIKEDRVRLRFSGSMRPVLIEPVDNPSLLHLISPVRTY